MTDIIEQYRKLIYIRSFEYKVLDMFRKNMISGTTHTCIGQEVTAVAAMKHIGEGDIVFSNHRCHGHYLAYGGPAKLLLAEIMSRENGLCGGRGGSQHIHYKNFYSNGIQGGIVPNATGMAWAEKMKGTSNIAVVFLGDGTLGQGIVYETLNMASLYEIPVLFIVENNQYAMTTSFKDAVAGRIEDRFKAFGIKVNTINQKSLDEMESCFEEAYSYVRNEKKPFCQIVNTYRLGAHSKSDDTRDAEEINRMWSFDIIKNMENEIGSSICDNIKEEIDNELNSYIAENLNENIANLKTVDCLINDEKKYDFLNNDNMKCVNAINQALDIYLEQHNDAIILGEDIRDGYGGAFKVTKGLSKKYDSRVINTPISEAGFTGLAVGLALGGIKPIVEIMFGDFVTLCFDQLLNHSTKYGWLYQEGNSVPLVMRLPMGAGRGYGPTHSQSLEKYLLGIPLLMVVAISPVFNIKELYTYALNNINSPLVFIENKKMYSEKMLVCVDNKIQDFDVVTSCNGMFPSMKLSLDCSESPSAVVIAYGGMVKEVMDVAVELLIEYEVQVDVIAISQLSPVPIDDIIELIVDCDTVGVVEEGTECCGWGAEIIASLASRINNRLYFRIASENMPIPNGNALEKQFVCNKEKIKDILLKKLR